MNEHWVTRESDDFVEQKRREEKEQYTIAGSEYFATLCAQIQSDAGEISTRSAWSPNLAGHPLKVTRDMSSIRVEKVTIDAVVVDLKHSREGVDALTRVIGMGFQEISRTEERWFASADEGGSIFLNRHSERLRVPDEASEHFLTPIVEMLKKEA